MYLEREIEEHLMRCIVKSVALMIGPLDFFMSDCTFICFGRDNYVISAHFRDFIDKKLVSIEYYENSIRFTFEEGLYIETIGKDLHYLEVHWNGKEWNVEGLV